MLTGTETVALSLGSAAIAGTVAVLGGLLTTNRRIEFDGEQNKIDRTHDREERIHDRQLLAADDLVTGLLQAYNAVDYILRMFFVDDTAITVASAATPELVKAEADARWAISEARNRLARFQLLFGEESAAAVTANVVLAEFGLIGSLIIDPAHIDQSEVRSRLVTVKASLSDFNTQAMAVLRPT